MKRKLRITYRTSYYIVLVAFVIKIASFTTYMQDDIIERMIANQGELFKKKMINTEGSTNPMKLKKGMIVLLIPEIYDKHEYKKTGCWELIDIKTGENTDQWYVQLKDPISQVNDFMVHISRVVPYHYDPRRGDAKAVRARDLKEMVVIRIEDHVCIGDKTKMSDYDFQCLWANGIKSWIPYSEASKLWMFETYTQNFDEFKTMLKSRNSRRKRAAQTPSTIPQQRRRNVQVNQLYQYTAGKPMDPPRHNSYPVTEPSEKRLSGK